MTDPAQATQKVVAVVVTHNRLSHLKRCLAALLAFPPADLTAVVVVDNASSDGTALWLAAQDPARLYVETCSENHGGAGGFARGIAAAQALFSPDWVLLLDDDAYPKADALTVFHARKPDASCAVASAVFRPDGEISALNRPFWNPFRCHRRLLRSLFLGRAGYYLSNVQMLGSETVPVDLATFVGFFVSKEALARVGLPSDDLFLYCDDLAFCDRLGRAGCKIIFEPSIQFVHACSTFTGRGRVYDPVWKSYYGHRNGLLFARSCAGRLAGPVTCALLGLWLMRAVFYPRPARYLDLLWIAARDALKADVSRTHTDILRRAARGVGWPKIRTPKPIVPTIKQEKATKPASL